MQGYSEMSGLAISPPRTMSENVKRNQHTSLSMTNLGLGRLDSSMTMVRKRESVATMILGGFPTPLHPTSNIGHINGDLCYDNMSVLVVNNDIQSLLSEQPLPLNVSSSGCKSFILGNIRKQYCKWIKTIWKKLENKSSASVGGINEDLRNTVLYTANTGIAYNGMITDIDILKEAL